MSRRALQSERDRIYSQEDDTHDMLIKAYLEYYKHNAAFEKRCSFRTFRKARRWLGEMQSMAKLRAKEIINDYNKNKHLKAKKPKND